jgi:Phage integrase, N-terminal SAM-like domain
MTALQGQNYSPKTLRAYGDDLKQFLAWVGENRVDWDITTRFSRADIEGFMSHLAGQQMTGITKARKLAGVQRRRPQATDPCSRFHVFTWIHFRIVTFLLKYYSRIENDEGTWARRQPKSGIH